MPKEHLEAVIKLTNEFQFEIVVNDEILVPIPQAIPQQEPPKKRSKIVITPINPESLIPPSTTYTAVDIQTTADVQP